MELYLYKCNICHSAKLSNVDYGSVWVTESCGGCKRLTCYEKVVVKGNSFVLEKSLYGKEKRNDDTGKSKTVKEK